MRRLAALAAVTALMLALASPALAEYGPLDAPDDPAMAYMLYHMAGPGYGKRTVWHPDAPMMQMFIAEMVMEALAGQMESELQPTEEDRQKIAELLETQIRAVVERSPEHPDRALVLLYFPDSDDEGEPLVFGVQRHGDEWRIYGMIPADEADPWTVFAPLAGN